MCLWKRKPEVYRVTKAWNEKGQTCWEVPAEEFDRLYAGQRVIMLDGKICSTIQFGMQAIIVFRGEDK